MKSVLMATAEFSPFVKAGGLGDVVGALPYALRKEGMDARVIMPLYSFIPHKIAESLKFVKETYVDLGWRKLYCGIYEIMYNGLPMYFIDNQTYFGGGRLYYDMENDIERFAFFSASVLNALPHIDFAPDVIHCHDWHTSLIPVIFHAHYRKVQYFKSIKTVFTIHNLKYQGICNKYKLYDILGISDKYSVAGSLAYGYDIANCLKGGLSVASKITTVSNTYAREIRDPYYGEGLDWLLNWRGQDLIGIVNGIDSRQYDPARDGAIAVNYTIDNAAQAKKQNKTALQAELGLPIDENKPMIALISRLVDQKGIDLIIHVFDEILASPGAPELSPQFVLLGTGEEHYEQFFKWKESLFPDRTAARIMFDEGLARRIYAGSDFFLMPSLFEPCGISQLIAMRYGSIPIVRETGGLADTVQSYNEATGKGNGYSFKNINAHDMLYTIRRALKYYGAGIGVGTGGVSNGGGADIGGGPSGGEGQIHDIIMKTAMSGDYSWDQSARKYKEMYNYL